MSDSPELLRINWLAVNQALQTAAAKDSEMRTLIDAQNAAIATLSERIRKLEEDLILFRVSLMGRGPTVT